MLKEKEQQHKDEQKILDRAKEDNAKKEETNWKLERNIQQNRENLNREEKQRNDLEGEVAILRNQLSDFASDLARKWVAVAVLNRELENKMQRLDAAKKNNNAIWIKLENEKNTLMT